VSGLPCQIEEERRAVAKPHRDGGGLSVALGKVLEILTLVFYALRGLMLLLIDLVKGAMKPKPPPRPKSGGPKGGTPSPSTPPSPTGAAPAPSTPTPGGPGPSEAAPAQASGSEVAPAVAVGVEEVQAPIPLSESDSRPPTQIESPEVTRVAAEVPAQVVPAVGGGSEGVSGAANAAVEKGETRPPAKASKTSAKSRASATRKGGNGKGTEGPKSEAMAKPRSRATKPLVQSVQKKAPRRGIRLKIDDGAGGEER
jgi:hypothetical protein